MCHDNRLTEEDLDCLVERFEWPCESWEELGRASQATIPALVAEIRLLRLVLTTINQNGSSTASSRFRIIEK